MSEQVTVKVNGDAEGYKDALKEVEKATSGLEDKLATVAKISAVAWAALSAEIAFATKAFAENDEAVRSLTASLKAQGIESESIVKSYTDIADKLENLTGVQDDVIIKGQSVLQSFLGQKEITEELNLAILDLSAGLGIDTVQAYSLVGKTVSGSINAFSRYGLQISETATQQEKLNAILKFPFLLIIKVTNEYAD